jgi:hypothetical protein
MKRLVGFIVAAGAMWFIWLSNPELSLPLFILACGVSMFSNNKSA